MVFFLCFFKPLLPYQLPYPKFPYFIPTFYPPNPLPTKPSSSMWIESSVDTELPLVLLLYWLVRLALLHLHSYYQTPAFFGSVSGREDLTDRVHSHDNSLFRCLLQQWRVECLVLGSIGTILLRSLHNLEGRLIYSYLGHLRKLIAFLGTSEVLSLLGTSEVHSLLGSSISGSEILTTLPKPSWF